jgi:hypothetical protein
MHAYYGHAMLLFGVSWHYANDGQKRLCTKSSSKNRWTETIVHKKLEQEQMDRNDCAQKARARTRSVVPLRTLETSLRQTIPKTLNTSTGTYLRPLCIKDLRGVCPVQVAAYSFFWFLL